jgi:DNA-binding NarL/FixJ family response regulator
MPAASQLGQKSAGTPRYAGRIVVAEDDVLLREGVAGLLERSGFEVAAQVGDASGLLRIVRDRPPDLVIVDVRMPPSQETEGLDAARVIRREHPDVGILVLSAYTEVDEAMELLATGRGIGYVLKSRVTELAGFIATVDQVLAGGSVIDPAIVSELIQVRRREDRLDALTRREREVLAFMAEGASNVGIANRLSVTEGTVEKHVGSILSKLRLPETQDAHRRVLAVLTLLNSR